MPIARGDQRHRPQPLSRLRHETSRLEAILTVGRKSSNVNDFALMTMLGLLGLRIFEATGVNIEALEEVHGHRVLRVLGKGETRLRWSRCHLPWGARSNERSTVGSVARS
jgi:site-specific recombinase XerC